VEVSLALRCDFLVHLLMMVNFAEEAVKVLQRHFD